LFYIQSLLIVGIRTQSYLFKFQHATLSKAISEVMEYSNDITAKQTEVFPCFFLSCKANARVKTRKDGARTALFQIICYLCCSVVNL